MSAAERDGWRGEGAAEPGRAPASRAPAPCNSAPRVPSPCVPCAPRTPAREEVSAGGVVYRLECDGAGRARPVFLLIRDSYRNWGFPKGHLEPGEGPSEAALREVAEETGLCGLRLCGAIETIDWYFRFRGRLVHKVCHFYLMRTDATATCPQRDEGITACRWAPFEEAVAMVSYANARAVLEQAQAMVAGPDAASATPAGASAATVSAPGAAPRAAPLRAAEAAEPGGASG